jgi:hypothetical protein
MAKHRQHTRPLVVDYKDIPPQEVKAAEDWARKTADRIFSHYTPQEMAAMRERNRRAKQP